MIASGRAARGASGWLMKTSPRLGHCIAEYIRHLSSVVIPPQRGFKQLLGRRTEPAAKIRVGDNALECMPGRIDVLRRYSKSVNFVAKDIVDAAVITTDNWLAGGHSFRIDGSERFIPTDQGKGVAPTHLLQYLLMGLKSE